MADSKCTYRFLGSSGLKVSNICLGAMTFGEHQLLDVRPGQCDEATAHAIMDRFAELGGNFIDTADAYQYGMSEEYVGSWLSMKQRDKFIIATKVWNNMDPTQQDPNKRGLSRHHILNSIDGSLRRLQTDYVDLYQIHCWDYGTPLEETMTALNDLVRAGKVRYIGASNVTGWQLQKIVEFGRTMGLNKWITLQVQYSLLCRSTEWELVEICRTEGLGLLPWSPLKGGWLAGKFTRDMTAAPAGTRVGWASEKEGRKGEDDPDFQQYANNENFWALDEVLKRVAKEQGKSVAQVSLRWLLQKDTVPSVIIGVKTLQQLEDNMGAAAGWELTQQQMADLDAASAVEIPYPYSLVWRANKATGRQRP
ncbi:1-deoxyxylulose-5-phosphate synthase YajO-like [Branchiostoma floridae x Branchiostoma belcheri]